MYSGVSGLKNHQTRMDVIGNNIANVNTAGYKKSRVVFKDTLYQTIRGASSATGARGGTNPMGIGLGMTVASIDQIHTPSPTTVTNKLTDMAVNGNGYFIVADGDQNYYTRAGAFDFDELGNLISTADGYKVKGWLADPNRVNSGGDWTIDTTGDTTAIDISNYKTVAPKATTSMEFSGNLNSASDKGWETDASKGNFAAWAGTSPAPPSGWTAFDENTSAPNGAVVTSKEIYDSLGNKQTLYFRYFKSVDDPTAASPVIQWYCDVSMDPAFGTANNPTADSYEIYDPANTSMAGVQTYRVSGIKFLADGSIDPTGTTGINLQIPRTIQGADQIDVKVDFSQLTQYDNNSTAWAENQDGYAQGDLTSYTVGIDGIIRGSYSNGEVRNLARVAVANFQNPSGLLQSGSNLYQVSNNSGDARVGAPGEEGMGSIIPGSLEMSNVDLSEEFTDMIVTQRGFQANSRIITTSDEMLQELVNLKR
jgi:flagellar hook protein FlgE